MEGKRRARADRFVQAASRCNLRRHMLQRNFAIVCLAFATLMDIDGRLSMQTPIEALAAVTGFLALLNLATLWRLRRFGPVTDFELLGHILADIGAFTVLVYFGEGAVNRALGAGLIAYFLGTIATLLHEHSRILAEARQRELTDEYLVRVGSLAAGAAHEIRSSLSTIAVLITDLLAMRHEDRATLTRDLRTMAGQIEACRRSLFDLLVARGDAVPESGRRESVKVFLFSVLDRWEMLRPEVKIACRWRGSQPPPAILTDRSLGQAILNLLDNSADAAPDEEIEMISTWNEHELRILIQDTGPGISPELGDGLGERPLTTKCDKGIGIGLLLAKTAIQRSGGSLELSNRAGGGACAEVLLPLAAWQEGRASQSVRQHG